jgi:tight adherence protein B
VIFMAFQLVLFVLLSMLVTIIYFMTAKTNNKLEKRKQQSSNMFRENVLKKRLEAIAEERVKYSKRYAIETLCLQAGFRFSFAEYLMISMGSALLLAILMMMVMNNPLFGLLFLVIGYMIPKQVITFLKNRRVALMEKQIGSFMLMILKRYENTRDFKASLELTMREFKGEEPLYSEIRTTVMDTNLGKPVNEALEQMARRTGNKYMMRLADYYTISSDIGTDDARKKMLNQAYMQYDENRKAKSMMKRELSAVKREAYIMVFSVPGFAVFQATSNDNYIHFMTQETMGQIGTFTILAVLAGVSWFINNKISAPLE